MNLISALYLAFIAIVVLKEGRKECFRHNSIELEFIAFSGIRSKN